MLPYIILIENHSITQEELRVVWKLYTQTLGSPLNTEQHKRMQFYHVLEVFGNDKKHVLEIYVGNI